MERKETEALQPRGENAGFVFANVPHYFRSEAILCYSVKKLEDFNIKILQTQSYSIVATRPAPPEAMVYAQDTQSKILAYGNEELVR